MAIPTGPTTPARCGATCSGRAAPTSRRRRRCSPRKATFKPLPPTGARTLDSRTAFYYGYTLDSPGMIMRIPGVGSQYLMGFLDADKKSLRRRQDLQGDAAEGHPRRAPSGPSRSTTTRRARCSHTPQRYPRAGSQSYPSPAAEAGADGSTTIYFGPTQPDGVKRGNWIQTMPGKGWFTILRLYSPLEPSSPRTGGRARSKWSSEGRHDETALHRESGLHTAAVPGGPHWPQLRYVRR